MTNDNSNSNSTDYNKKMAMFLALKSKQYEDGNRSPDSGTESDKDKPKETPVSEGQTKTPITPSSITFSVETLKTFHPSIVSMLEVLNVVVQAESYKAKAQAVEDAKTNLDRQTRKLDKQKNDADYTEEDVNEQSKKVNKAQTEYDRAVKEEAKTLDILRNTVGSLPEKVDASKPAMKEFKKMVEAVAPLFKELQAKTETEESEESEESEEDE